MMTISVEFVGGPRDGLVLGFEWDEPTDTLLVPVDPTFKPEVIPVGTPVHAWAVPEDIPPETESVKVWYLGERVFEGGGRS